MIDSKPVKVFKDNFEFLSDKLVKEDFEKFYHVKIQKEEIEAAYRYNFIEKFNHASSLIKKYKPEINTYNLEETPNFNIFSILGLHKKEVITHTPFLANLLNEFDSHQHQRLFLDSFLKGVIGLDAKQVDNRIWKVIKERENIDLKIINKRDQIAIFIENKIATGAHSGQLSRYFKNWKENYKGGAFVYLTVNGDDPSIEGFNEDTYSRNLIEKELLKLSYKDNIRKWLELCLPEIKSNKLLYTVKQYLELINIL
jgi:hypothetical protein